MGTVWAFLTKFSSLIVCTLHCFDRVILKGHLAMARPSELERYVDYVLRIRRSHFIKSLAPQWAERLIREQRIERGLVGILCTLETCNSFTRLVGLRRSLVRISLKEHRQSTLQWQTRMFADAPYYASHRRLAEWPSNGDLPKTIAELLSKPRQPEQKKSPAK